MAHINTAILPMAGFFGSAWSGMNNKLGFFFCYLSISFYPVFFYPFFLNSGLDEVHLIFQAIVFRLNAILSYKIYQPEESRMVASCHSLSDRRFKETGGAIYEIN